MTDNDRMLRRTATRIGGAMLVFLFLFYALTIFAQGISEVITYNMEDVPKKIIGELFNMTAYFASFVLPGIFLILISRRRPEYRPVSLRFRLPALTPVIIIAGIAFNLVIAYVNSFTILTLFPNINTGAMDSISDEAPAVYELILAIFSTAVVPALCEEFLFRGAILTQLKPFGNTAAIVVSAVLFGLMHQNVLQILYTTMLGIVLGIICVRIGSLWCGVLLHFFNNLYSVLQEYIDAWWHWDRLYALTLFLLIGGGALCIALLLKRAKKETPDPRETGSFGRLYEQSYDYDEYPVSAGYRLRMLASPTIIVFGVLALLSACGTLLILLAM